MEKYIHNLPKMVLICIRMTEEQTPKRILNWEVEGLKRRENSENIGWIGRK